MLLYHYGDRFQKGRGLGSLFAGLIKTIVPMTKTFLKSSTGQTLKNVALKTASDFASDVVSGKNIKDAAKDNLSQAKATIGTYVKRKLGVDLDDDNEDDIKQPVKKKLKVNKKKGKFNLLNEDDE